MGQTEELVKLSHLWRDADGGLWLVIFDFATVDGRRECVGFSIRSYVKCLEVVQGINVHEAIVHGPVTGDDLTANVEEMAGKSLTALLLFPEFVMRQSEAVRATDGAGLMVRPLTSQILRQFAFYSELVGAKRTQVDRLRLIRQEEWPSAFSGLFAVIESEIDKLEQPCVQPAKRGRGRPPKYTENDLRRVAAVWHAAVDRRRATLEVAQTLNLTRAVAEKLVRRCRQHVPPLIPPRDPPA